jgi:sugar/nucleoside kinase (ribokinase family)
MIAAVGDLMLDVFLLSDLQQEEQGRGIILRPGGSAANTAAWIAQLGMRSAFVGCVGSDLPGRLLINDLEDYGVASRVRSVQGVETGSVAIEVRDDGERVMRSARGANEALCTDDINRLETLEPVTVHVTGYALLGAAGLDLLTAVGQVARSACATVSFDPSSVGVIRRFGASFLLRTIREAEVALLLPNTLEAQALTGCATSEEAARRLSKHTQAVVIKDGPRGATYSSAGEVGRVPVEVVRPVDTTGAGDAFNAGVLAARYLGDEWSAACARGHHCAREVLGRYGARPLRSR